MVVDQVNEQLMVSPVAEGLIVIVAVLSAAAEVSVRHFTLSAPTLPHLATTVPPAVVQAVLQLTPSLPEPLVFVGAEPTPPVDE